MDSFPEKRYQPRHRGDLGFSDVTVAAQNQYDSQPRKRFAAQYPENYKGYHRYGTGKQIQQNNVRKTKEELQQTQDQNEKSHEQAARQKQQSKQSTQKLFDDEEYGQEIEKEELDDNYNNPEEDYNKEANKGGWTDEDEDENEEEERGHYEDTRAKGTYRRTNQKVDQQDDGDYDGEDDGDFADDRDQFEDFELITQKFIPYMHEITDEILLKDLKIHKDKFHLYQADWMQEKNAWEKRKNIYKEKTRPFLSDWTYRTYSMKAKFRCPKCQRKGIPQDRREVFQKNGYTFDEDDQVAVGWTTGCCTVQLLYKQLRSQDPNSIELKFLVRAYSQFCKSCNKVGDIGTYRDEIERISNTFSQYLVRQFYQNYRPPRIYYAQRASEMARPHLSELCSACKNGCCIQMKKQQFREQRELKESTGGKFATDKYQSHQDHDQYYSKHKGYWSDEEPRKQKSSGYPHAKSDRRQTDDQLYYSNTNQRAERQSYGHYKKQYDQYPNDGYGGGSKADMIEYQKSRAAAYHSQSQYYKSSNRYYDDHRSHYQRTAGSHYQRQEQADHRNSNDFYHHKQMGQKYYSRHHQMDVPDSGLNYHQEEKRQRGGYVDQRQYNTHGGGEERGRGRGERGRGRGYQSHYNKYPNYK